MSILAQQDNVVRRVENQMANANPRFVSIAHCVSTARRAEAPSSQLSWGSAHEGPPRP